jgi:aryl-alcohol dehydrogenase-like predicted oxidoreductase
VLVDNCMRYTRFGTTKLEVSNICFGTWAFGGDWGSTEVQDSKSAIRRARELGINFFDTAQAYGWGAAEQVLGQALAEEIKSDRDNLVLATKGGLRLAESGLLRDSSPKWLRAGLEESLRNLGTDYIDIYQVHWPDPDVSFDQTAATLDEFVREGKVRYLGVSNFDASQLSEFEAARKIDALQPPYHLFRRHIEEEVLPYCREHGIGVLVYGPLAHGLLTGKMTTQWKFDDDDWRAGSELFTGATFERTLDQVESIRALADQAGYSVSQLAVAWTLANPDVDVSIVGARNRQQIDQTAPASELDLDEEIVAELENITSRLEPVGGPSPESV